MIESRAVVVACSAVCLVLAAWSLSLRHKAEASNRAVGLMLESSVIESLAATSGKSYAETLEYLAERGLTGVAMTEETVQTLVDRGAVEFAWVREGHQLRLVLDAAPEPARIRRASARRFSWPRKENNFDGPFSYVDLGSVLETPIGLDPARAEQVNNAGLVLIARHENVAGANENYIVDTLAESAELGADAYLIGGDQALGSRTLMETTANALRDQGMVYLSPEFVVLGGDAYLRNELAETTIRLHSIQQLESERLSSRALLDRMKKAFRERNVRWLLLRPTTQASSNSVEEMGRTLVAIRAAVRSVGGEVKQPRPFQDPAVPQWLIVAISLLAAPAIAWTVSQVLTVRGGQTIAWVGVLAFAGATVIPEVRAYYALLAAIAYPVFGYLLFARKSGLHAIVAFLGMCAASLVGGVVVASTLVGVEFMVRAEVFRGVKLAMFAPIAIVAWLMIAHSGGIKKLSLKPVTWGSALVAFGALAVGALVLARTGNDNPGAVSAVEIQLRSVIDQLLSVRPRSKELFLGYPALLIGLALIRSRANGAGWAAGAILVGMIAQTSLINTLCHLHTPIVLGLARLSLGILLGGIIGWLLWLLGRRLFAPSEASN